MVSPHFGAVSPHFPGPWGENVFCFPPFFETLGGKLKNCFPPYGGKNKNPWAIRAIHCRTDVVVVAGVTDRDIALGMELGRHTFVYVTANITPSGR